MTDDDNKLRIKRGDPNITGHVYESIGTASVDKPKKDVKADSNNSDNTN